MRLALAILIVAAACVPAGRAESVRNGNELALAFTRADAAGRGRLQQEQTGRIHTFRYLQVTNIAAQANGNPVYATVEPSSDMTVVLMVSGAISLQIAATVATGDCLAVKGRIQNLGSTDPAVIVLDPALIRNKDREAPKVGRELLNEVDDRAH